MTTGAPIQPSLSRDAAIDATFLSSLTSCRVSNPQVILSVVIAVSPLLSLNIHTQYMQCTGSVKRQCNYFFAVATKGLNNMQYTASSVKSHPFDHCVFLDTHIRKAMKEYVSKNTHLTSVRHLQYFSSRVFLAAAGHQCNQSKR